MRKRIVLQHFRKYSQKHIIIHKYNRLTYRSILLYPNVIRPANLTVFLYYIF